jgi:hypothetical protein
MTAPSSPDAARLGAHPLTIACAHRRLDLTTSDTSITLVDGVYEVYNAGTVLAYVRIGSAVIVPSTGAAEVAGQAPVPAGGAVTLAMGAGDLHALTASGTATLEILRKVAT